MSRFPVGGSGRGRYTPPTSTECRWTEEECPFARRGYCKFNHSAPASTEEFIRMISNSDELDLKELVALEHAYQNKGG